MPRRRYVAIYWDKTLAASGVGFPTSEAAWRGAGVPAIQTIDLCRALRTSTYSSRALVRPARSRPLSSPAPAGA